MNDAPRHHLVTIVSVAIVAWAAADLVHEALGHGIASWLAGDPILSISSVALQNARPDRFVAAAGTAANVGGGALAFLVLRGSARFKPWTYFLWLFGVFGLLNSGYLIVSALMGVGDWAAVTAGWEPALFHRVGLGLVGAALYLGAMRWAAGLMRGFVERGEIAAGDLRRLTVPAYLASGLLMTAASVFNPIDPSLILLSGVGASFGLNAGLLFLPGMVAPRAGAVNATPQPLPFSLVWAGLALVVGVAFVAVLGPGIRFAAR